MSEQPLKFIVAPHIVEDLGLNLYTNLPRVLVEFVANAYDADSPFARITLDKNAIDDARRILKQQYELEKAEKAAVGESVEPLETRALPEQFLIIIEDAGHGMAREDLQSKFLIAGRRRLEEVNENGRSPKDRPLMGRKGLGKLAGFGVAKRIEVVSRKAGEAHATKIVMEYDELIKKRDTNEVEVQEERLDDGGGLEPSGTRIILSMLLYDPLRSRAETIEQELAEHFDLITPEEFQITLNQEPIKLKHRTIAFAWPLPDECPVHEFVEHTLEREGGGPISFEYRLRFTGDREALPGGRRGVRVYVNKRLAAAPSLLGADTNMHGFRMTDYLDGIVHADFIALEKADYIATDRQTLRWESPLLSGLYDFLSEQIKNGCAAYQRRRDSIIPSQVKKDEFTQEIIAESDLSPRDETLAYRVASSLAAWSKRGVEDPQYRSTLPGLVKSIGHGQILAAISELAALDHPDLNRVAIEIARLTKDELDSFVGFVRARLQAITALKKIVDAADFTMAENEKVLQEMFEESPWLLDPTYTQFLTANQPFNSLFIRLASELAVGQFAPSGARSDRRRPDLVFLIGSLSLGRIVIVELKSANTPLGNEHLTQLMFYISRSEDWLRAQSHPHIQVRGELIGTLPSPTADSEGAVVLRKQIADAGSHTPWRVRDYLNVLSDTEAAHSELLDIYRRTEDTPTDAAVLTP